MKILRVIATIDPNTGGPLEGLKRASAIMSELGVEVEVLTLDEPSSFQAAADALAWPVYREGSEKRSYYGYSQRFKKWINQHAADYDAIIIHGNWQYTGIATSRACRKAGVPYFVYPHGMLDPWFNQTYPLKKIKKQLYWWLAEHSVLHHANAVLFTSEEECRLARQSFKPYRVKENILGYGTTAPDIDAESAANQLRASAHAWAKSPYFLFLGRIQEKKGLDLLIAAYSQLKQEHAELPALVIAGPEQQPKYVAHLKNNFPQTGIHWIGAVTGPLKWQTVAAAEALTLVSHQENFGIVVAEALALGTPVLISDKVNIWREIMNEGAGFVANDTKDGALQLLQQWQALSAQDKINMRARAQTSFKQHFELRNATQRLIQLLKETTTH
jgi:glycosyltransferase involved in cell wall biosynthesis